MGNEKLLLTALQGKPITRIPFWFMRQAGRYLPEYRATRASSKGFLDLCFSPDKAAEVTLQPIRRFGMDGAILFSDILVIPHALGAHVTFTEGEGPSLSTIQEISQLDALQFDDAQLSAVYETIGLVKTQLPKTTTFLGFAGAPWTIACYMLQGKGGNEFQTARSIAYQNPKLVQALIDKITDATILYLKKQIATGVDAVQIFDSWAGYVNPHQFHDFCIRPIQKIVNALKQEYPNTPIIGFPKNTTAHLKNYAANTGVDVIGIDQFTPLAFAKTQCGTKVLQGNLDPVLLASDKEMALAQAEMILQEFGMMPAVFNLGHGMLPHTPLAHVEALCHKLRNYEIRSSAA